jgi:ornithine carbamoyltransferase
MTIRHFLCLNDFTSDELRGLVNRAVELKAIRNQGELFEPLKGKTLAMIFTKSSTRTRVSFEAGMAQLGGSALYLEPGSMQLGRGEPLEDTARVISRMVDAVMIRTSGHEFVETFASVSKVPVINALTDKYHPCQLLADIQTWQERHGDIRGKTAAWIGDGNNVCHSWMNAARLFGFKLNIATPEGYEPDPDIVVLNRDVIMLCHNPAQAVDGVDVVVTDTWASMGQEDEKIIRGKAFAGFIVDEALMQKAAPEALFMHCLPAYRGSEVSDGVIEGPQSVVWEEAENRLHAQKALLEFLIG